MMLMTRGTLDSTPPYKSTSGDNILKGQKIITGVCFDACYIRYAGLLFCGETLRLRTHFVRVTRSEPSAGGNVRPLIQFLYPHHFSWQVKTQMWELGKFRRGRFLVLE